MVAVRVCVPGDPRRYDGPMATGKRAMKGAADREVLTQADSVVRTLPKPFLEFLEAIQAAKYGDGLGQSPGYVPKDPDLTQCVDGGRDFSSKVPLRAGFDSAKNLEDSVHRRLRKIAREGMKALGGTVGAEARCGGCGRYGEAGWSFCAFCGRDVTGGEQEDGAGKGTASGSSGRAELERRVRAISDRADATAGPYPRN